MTGTLYISNGGRNRLDIQNGGYSNLSTSTAGGGLHHITDVFQTGGLAFLRSWELLRYRSLYREDFFAISD